MFRSEHGFSDPEFVYVSLKPTSSTNITSNQLNSHISQVASIDIDNNQKIGKMAF